MNIFKEIKYFIQRGIRGFCDRDLWSFDDYLCDIIPLALKQLAKNSHGCPSDLYDKKAKNNECHKWIEILEEIAQGFEAAKEITGLNYFRFVKDKKYPDYFIHEIDKEKAKLITEKYDRGIKLFCDYFLNLWD